MNPHRIILTGIACVMMNSPALASYGQMRLDGLLSLFVLVLISGYALLIGVLLLFKVFRSRVMAILGTTLSIVLTGLWVASWHDLNHLINDVSRSLGGVVALLILLAIVLVMLFILWAPFAQYRRARRP